MGRDKDMGIVDVSGVTKLSEYVVFPATVERGVGNTGGADLVGEGDARAIEREHIMVESNPVESHEGDEKDGGERKLRLNALLEVADEAEHGGDEKAE